MNPDNPYAAPQTVEPQFAADEPLPVAALVGRQRYPELDTTALQRLEKLSRAIEWATVLWMMPLLCSFGAAVITLLVEGLTSGWGLGLFVFVGLCVFRLYVGSAHRIVIRVIDALLLILLSAAMLAVIAGFMKNPGFHLFLLLMLGCPAIMLVDSIRATFYAQALFGSTPYNHRELVNEEEYRRANQIP